MKYVANPVVVDAFKVTDIKRQHGEIQSVELDNEIFKYPSPEMLARIKTKVGDYWVVQVDGYEYLNPKEVFERKYSFLKTVQEKEIMSEFTYKIAANEDIVRVIESLAKRMELCEKVFIKIMQHDIRIQTLEFNSDMPVQPSASEKLMDMQHRIERLESYLTSGEKQ